jgi:formylglycine-generating enzyme required for sulfatase activity
MPAYQMAGNAWEFVEGPVTADDIETFMTFLGTPDAPPPMEELWVQIRGGSFKTPLASAVAYKFVAVPQSYAAPDVGFRCAKTP